MPNSNSFWSITNPRTVKLKLGLPIAGQEGRNPGPEDLQTKDTFRNYIRSVINSIVEGWARTHHRNGHCSLDVIQDIVAAPEAAQIEYQELLAQLFVRLRQRAPARLLPTIEAWEQSPDGRIAMIQDLL